jgi:predicted membrane metal-binding protein
VYRAVAVMFFVLVTSLHPSVYRAVAVTLVLACNFQYRDVAG